VARMGDHRTLTKLTAVTLGLAVLGTACGDDSSSGGSVESWCDLMGPANEVEAIFDSFETLDPDALKAGLDEVEEVNNQLVAAAPDEIKDDARTLNEYTEGLITSVRDADYVLFDADLSFLGGEAEQAALEEANVNLDTYSIENCGQAFGSDDTDSGGDTETGGDDADFDPEAGTIRDQLVSQFVAIGFTQHEAECMADGVDPTDESILSGDQDAILGLFDACGIPLSRLAELGG